MKNKIKMLLCIAAFVLGSICLCVSAMAQTTNVPPANEPTDSAGEIITSSEDIGIIATSSEETPSITSESYVSSDVPTESIDSSISTESTISSDSVDSDITSDILTSSDTPIDSDVSSDVVSNTEPDPTVTSYSSYSSYSAGDYDHYISIYSTVSEANHSVINSENWSNVSLDANNSKEMQQLMNAGQKGDFSFIKNRTDSGSGSAWYWLAGGIALITIGGIGLLYTVITTMKAKKAPANASSGGNRTRKSSSKKSFSRGDTAEIKLPKNRK